MAKNKEILKSKRALMDLPSVKSAKLIETHNSSVTTAWGVNWSEDYIARDILQNFRDANKEDINSIKVNVKKDDVTVHGEALFNLRRLFYVGSEKGEGDIGQYGEGFKAAMVSMIKKGVTHPISISGDKAVVIRVGDEIDDTSLCPLVYDFYKVNKHEGTLFSFSTNNPEMKKAFTFGMKHFWYKENSLLGKEIFSHNDFSVHQSKEENGYVFYNGIKRADIKKIPIVINVGKKYAAIEKKIDSDRDRNSFDGKLQDRLFGIFAQSGIPYYSKDACYYEILKLAKPVWEDGGGHPLLQAIGKNLYGIDKLVKTKTLFSDKYFAESQSRYNPLNYQEWYEEYPQIRQTEKKYEENGKIKLPGYFACFGVPSVSLEIHSKNVKIEKEIEQNETRSPNRKEQQAIDFLIDGINELSPSFGSLYKNIYSISYKIVKSDDLLGQLKEKRGYWDKVVYLNENLFSKSFGEILSVLLHELCHVFGGDGRRSFSDILTYLIRVSIDERNTLDKYALLWKNYKINESDRSRIAILKPIQSTLADKIAEYRKNLER